MSRLPRVGGDAGKWGDILNDFLSVEHNADGTLKKAGDIADAKTKANDAVKSSDIDTDTSFTANSDTKVPSQKAVKTNVDKLKYFTPESYNGPMISFSFDDGWKCQLDNAVPVLNAANVKGSFAITSDFLGTKRNSSLAVDPLGEDIMTGSEVKTLYDTGHEICNHTKTHPHFASYAEPAAILNEVDTCNAALESLGVVPSDVFVLPFGDPDWTDLGTGCIGQRFKAVRTVSTTAVHTSTAPTVGNIFDIRSCSQHSLDTLDDIKKSVDVCNQNGTWLVFTFHHVSSSLHPAATTIWWDSQNLADLIAYVQSLGIRIVTMGEGLRLRNRACENLIIGGNLTVDSVTKGPGQSNYLGIWNKTLPAGVTDTYDTTERYTPYTGAASLASRRIDFSGSFTTYVLTQEIPVEPFTDYVLGYAVKTSNLTGPADIRIAFHNMESGAIVTTATLAWTPQSCTLNSGPNRRLLVKVSVAATSGSCWLSAISCRKARPSRNEAHNLSLFTSRLKLLPDQSRYIAATGEVWHDVNTHTLRTQGTSGNRETIPSYLKLTSKTVNIAETTIAHGLGRTPTMTLITPTSAGQIWQSKAADGTNVYLKADADGRTCDLCVS